MVEPPRSRVKLRAENLSDLVFGLALSIGSVILISNFPQSPSDLFDGIVTFGFSFLIVVWIWAGYTDTMAEVLFEVRGAFLLNIALLFCVAVEPYLFYVVNRSQDILLEASSSTYGIDVGAMMFILAGLKRLALTQHAASPLPQKRALRRSILTNLAAGVIFSLSALPFFWIHTFSGDYLRFDVWYAALLGLGVGSRFVPIGKGTAESSPTKG